MTSKRDTHQRQRTRSGVLTEAEVARIKLLLKQGMSARQVKEYFPVSLWTIRAIARGDTWDWVAPEGEGEIEPPPAILTSAELAQAARESQERMIKRLNDAANAIPAVRVERDLNKFMDLDRATQYGAVNIKKEDSNE